MLTLGQYLQPTRGRLPVLRYIEPARFKQFEQEALAMGFRSLRTAGAAIGGLGD